VSKTLHAALSRRERQIMDILYQLGRANEEMYGLPLDAYISQLFGVALEEDPFFRGVPPEVYRIDDMSERLFAMALTARGWDLRAIRATNPTTLLLFARVVRGGNWADDPLSRSAARNRTTTRATSEGVSDRVGFRCARSAKH
jgi:hypothetical protein